MPNVAWVSAWSVGRIIRLRYPIPSFVSDAVLESGRLFHSWSEAHDQGQAPTPQEAIRPYCEAYKAYTYALSPSYTQIEYVFDNGEFHGIVDRVGYLRNKLSVIELKTGGAQKWHGVQLAFYTKALYPTSALDIQRLGVYLRKNGTYEVRVYDDVRDYLEMSELLRLATEKETQHGNPAPSSTRHRADQHRGQRVDAHDSTHHTPVLPEGHHGSGPPPDAAEDD